jgi:hypothetical protein
MADAPDEEIDRLYGLALEEFIPARDALSKELRDTGRRGEATAVKKLSKPTVAAWAVNQAVRSQPRAARELWDAGDALAAAQEAVLSGKGSGASLREAAERERLALDPLVDAARGLLTASGGDLSETTIDRVRSTLQAAAIDADAREDVAAGRAVRERAPRGLFGGGEAAGAPAARGGSATRAGSATRGGSTRRDRSAGPDGTEEKHARGRTASGGRSAASGRGRSAAQSARSREEAAARKREEAAARKREREEEAARGRARKAATARVARAENALAAAEARSAKAAEQLEDARAREREAVEALADARAELRAVDR